MQQGIQRMYAVIYFALLWIVVLVVGFLYIVGVK